jgi:uncharacterized membrane protein YfcA
MDGAATAAGGRGAAVIEHQLLGAGLGAIIGAVLALTGAGGGILAVPLLVFGLGLSMVEAAPIGLLAVAAAVGALLGLREGLVRYRAALFIALIGIVASPFGLMLAHQLPNTPLALVFAGVLVYACLRIWRKAARQLRGEANDAHRFIEPCVLNPLQGRLRWTLPCARAWPLLG